MTHKQRRAGLGGEATMIIMIIVRIIQILTILTMLIILLLLILLSSSVDSKVSENMLCNRLVIQPVIVIRFALNL